MRISWSRLVPLLVAGCFSADADRDDDSGGGCSGGGTRGALGRGTFSTSDCPNAGSLAEAAACLGLEPFAAGARAAVRFRPDDGDRAITGVTSTDPSAVRTDAVTFLDDTSVAFEVLSLAAGDAVVQVVHDLEVVDQLPIQVVPVASVVASVPAKTMVGGVVVVSGTPTGAAGEPLIGRGGYELAATPGLTIEAVAPGTPGLLWEVGPDYVVHATAPGDYLLVATPATSTPLRLTVVDPAALREVRLSPSEFGAGASQGFVSVVAVAATDDVGDALAGVACDWQASRPVTFEPFERYPDVVHVRSQTNEPVDITCVIAGTPRATVTIR